LLGHRSRAGERVAEGPSPGTLRVPTSPRGSGARCEPVASVAVPVARGGVAGNTSPRSRGERSPRALPRRVRGLPLSPSEAVP
jgi:hypothetical protein